MNERLRNMSPTTRWRLTAIVALALVCALAWFQMGKPTLTDYPGAVAIAVIGAALILFLPFGGEPPAMDQEQLLRPLLEGAAALAAPSFHEWEYSWAYRLINFPIYLTESQRRY